MSIQFIRLIDFRPLDQLLRMTDAERESLCTEVLGRGPSEASWLALWELFASWPEGETKTRQLAAAERALDGWPDRVRSMTSASQALYDGARLAPLARLLRSIEISRRDDSGASELLAIASSPEAAGLTYLNIVRSGLNSVSWRALVESPHLARLRHLHVVNTVLTGAHLQQLFESTALTQLGCLKLIDVGLRPRTLEAVRPALPWPRLCALDLSSNALGDEGAMMLCRPGWPSQLEQFALRDNEIRAAAMQALLLSPLCERARRIDLSGNRASSAEKGALAALAATRQIEIVL